MKTSKILKNTTQLPQNILEPKMGSIRHKKQYDYNKDKGCSVKAQEDNLFDYTSLLKTKNFPSTNTN